LEETIRSVLLQNYPNLEYIIVDGGSSDNSVDVIKKYERYLAFWCSENDRGQAHALNKGFAMATGTIACFLNSDDVFAPGALFAVASAFVAARSPSNALICGEVADFDVNGLVSVFRNISFGRLYKWLGGGTSLHQPGTFWSSALFHRNGPFPLHFRYIFDRYFYTRLAFRGVKFIHIAEVVAYFRLHDASKTVVEGSRFEDEWATAAAELRRIFAVRGRIMELAGRRLDRFLAQNWKCAGNAASTQYGRMARREVFLRVLKCPVAIFHRPMAGAAVRCGLNLFRRR
jgi:glycosyltransferase involved in cell wall biosynthesis